MEEASVGMGIKVVLLEMVENLADMVLVFFFRVRIDEYVAKAHQYAYIE